ncbi:MAG: hypothetical protein JSV17_16500 [Candidatus Aminicenantes bacterium]|nr:MAG: hypothetical protein JSV17_16500 [Candidatus Aminicenantes bacterium]
MKKIYVLVLLCIPLFLILGFRTIGVSGQQAQQPRGPSYHLETDHIAMKDFGKLLERIGKEIQQEGQITIGGDSYPVTDFGGLELHVSPSQRLEGTSIGLELSSGRKGVPPKGTTYISYQRGRIMGTPPELAEVLAKLGKTLASKGAFVIDDHSVAFEGKAKVVQHLTQTLSGRRGSSYTLNVDVMFGDKDFPVPQDEAEDIKAMRSEESGRFKELAKKEMTDTDQEAIVKLFDTLSGNLKDGRIRLGDQDLEAGENISCSLSHLIAMDGSAHRIRVGIQFGIVRPQRQQEGPRYSEEFFDKPMKRVGALLQRIGTEILETGTFKLGETEFKVKKFATYEISANDRGFEIGLGYTEPTKKE